MNAIKKPQSSLKNVLEKPQSISSVLVVDLPSITRNMMQTRWLILPSLRDKTKHEVKKALM
jgi:hypothetical protein